MAELDQFPRRRRDHATGAMRIGVVEKLASDPDYIASDKFSDYCMRVMIIEHGCPYCEKPILGLTCVDLI
jgi:hypothetical protein